LNDYSSPWVDFGFNNISLVNQAFIIASTGCLFFGLGLRTPINKKRFYRKKISFYNHKIFRYQDFKLVTVILFVAGLFFTLYHLNLYLSTGDNILLFLSPTGRRDSDVGVSQLILLLGYGLIWSSIFFTIQMFHDKRKLLKFLLIFVSIILIYLVSAKRSTVIPIFLIPLIYFHYSIGWIKISKAIRYFLVGIFLIISTIYVRILLPTLVRGRNPDETIGSDFAEIGLTYLGSGEFMTFDMFLLSIREASALNDFVGGQMYGFFYYSFATIASVIPSAIWPTKPDFHDLGQKYYQFIENDNESIGYAVTVFGSGYQFFNILGITIGFFLIGWFSKFIYYSLKPYEGFKSNVIIYGIFFWMLFQFLRFGTMGFTLLLFIQTMLIGLLAVLFVSRNKVKM